MTRARNIAGFSTITTTPSPVHVGPIGVLTATRIDGEFNQVDLATRNITAAGIAATNLQVSGITTGLNVSGIITAQNGINFNGTSTGLNVSGVATFANNVSIGGVLTYEDVTNVDSVGVITARSDINLGDSIIHIGDTDTKIRFPAANQISFETTGSEAVRIDESGRLGIGDDNPSQLLTVKGNAPIIRIQENQSGGSKRLDLGVTNSGAVGYIGANQSASSLAFQTVGIERMRITPGGLIGIGTDSPAGDLDIRGQTGTDSSRIYLISGDAADSSIYFGSANDTATGALRYEHTDDSLRIYGYNNTERLRVLSDGQLKHTAASGSTIITFQRTNTNTSGAVGVLNFAASDDHSVANIQVLGDGDNEGAHIVFKTTTAAASADPYNAATVERLRITSDGKFSFNYAGTPSNDMLLKSTVAHTSLALYSTSESTKATFQTVQDDDIRFGSTSNHPVSFYANSNQFMQLDTSGRLLIGTESTATVSDGESPKLQIKGPDSTAGISIVRYSANSGGSGIYIAKSRNTTHGSNTVLQDGDELGRITFSGDDGGDLHTQGVALQAMINGSPSGNALPAHFSIFTNPGTHALTERIRVTANGRVLVRTTTNNGCKFVVNQAENDTMSTSGNMTTGFFLGCSGMGSAALNIGTDNTDIWFNAAYANNAGTARGMKFYTGGTQRLAIGTNGKITHGAFEPDYGPITITLSSGLNSGVYQTVIPGGQMGHTGVYAISIFWNYNGQGATPYYALASFMFSAAATNNTSANNAENLLTSCHVGGNYYLSARSLTVSSSTTALQVAIHGWTAAANSEFIVKYKRVL